MFEEITITGQKTTFIRQGYS